METCEYRVQYQVTEENRARLEKASNRDLNTLNTVTFSVDNPVAAALVIQKAGDDGVIETRHLTEWVQVD